MNVLLKTQLIKNYMANPNLDAPYLTMRSGKTYTARQMADEVRNETEFGKKRYASMIKLTVNMLAKNVLMLDEIKVKLPTYEEKVVIRNATQIAPYCINTPIAKFSGKPFPSGFMTDIVTGLIPHPHKVGGKAYTLAGGSYIDTLMVFEI